MVDIELADWSDIEDALDDEGFQIGIFGPPGIGKTTACFRSAERRGKRIEKYQCTAEGFPAELMGYSAPKKGGHVWVPGPGELCYKHGGMLLLDEIDQASGAIKTYLYGILDRGPGGTISLAGRKFIQQPGYQAVATMNEDPTNGSLPPALLDRFDAWYMVLEPHPDLLDLLEPDLRSICIASYAAAAEPPSGKNEAWNPLEGPDITFRMLMGLQRARRIHPIHKAVISICRGNQTLARNLLEMLALMDDEDDEEEDGD